MASGTRNSPCACSPSTRTGPASPIGTWATIRPVSGSIAPIELGASAALPVELERRAYVAAADDLAKQVGETAGPEFEAALRQANQQMSVAMDAQSLAASKLTRAPARSRWWKVASPIIGGAMGLGGGALGGQSPLGLAGGAALGTLWEALAPRADSTAMRVQEITAKLLQQASDSPDFARRLSLMATAQAGSEAK